MKKIIIIFLLGVYSFGAAAQSNIRLNNYWDNLFSINPAAINNNYLGIASIADRKQWVGFTGAPNTVFGSASVYVDAMHTQVGLKLYRDKIGYTSTTNIALAYAYAVLLNDEWTLNLGLSGNLHSLSYDLNKINMTTVDDPKVYRILENGNDFNSELGAELVSKRWRFGASSQNLFSVFSKEKRKIYPYTNFLYGTYRGNTTNLLDMGFGVNAIQSGKLYQMEMIASGYLKNYDEEDLGKLGLFYRSRHEMGAILGVNLGPRMYISYSYDFNIGSISRSSVGSHELMVILRLNKIQDCNCIQYK